MGSYTVYDYTESLDRVNISAADVEKVIAAWGDQGEYAEWEGGFILKMREDKGYEKPYAYIWGWCDTTGWGCQDGATVEWYETEPERIVKRGMPQHMGGYLEVLGGGDPSKWEQEWDESPADLNKWIEDGCPDDRKW